MALSAYHNLETKQFAPGTNVTATGVLGSAVDVSDYKGIAGFVLSTSGITDTDSKGSSPCESTYFR